jgi:hypothetical protein
MTTDRDALTSEPYDPEEQNGTEDQRTRSASRKARMRVAILSGMTIGAAVVVALSDSSPTTVASIVRGI